MATQEPTQNIIIFKKKIIKGGHHGGSWKVAFADFATAMMAFFLVMWITNMSSPEELKSIAGYFEDPNKYPGMLDAVPSERTKIVIVDSPEDANALVSQEDILALDVATIEHAVQKRKKRELNKFRNVIEAEIKSSTAFEKFGEQIIFEITPDGLKINIIDDLNRPMFEASSTELTPFAEELISSIAGPLQNVTNKISIAGHTDSSKFLSTDYTNWELSSDRANSARRALVSGGLETNRFLRIIGLADTIPMDEKDLNSPLNRRISITVMTKDAEIEFLERHKMDAAKTITTSDENEFNPNDIGEVLDKSELLHPVESETDLDISDDSILERTNDELNQDFIPLKEEDIDNNGVTDEGEEESSDDFIDGESKLDSDIDEEKSINSENYDTEDDSFIEESEEDFLDE